MYDAMRLQLNRSVPFAAHTGVELISIAAGNATATLDQSATSINHIGSQHAGALFTLGEAASGAAMAGLFADQLGTVRPVTSDASIRYVRIARGRITASALCSASVDDLLAALERDGRVSFAIDVTLADETSATVATMQVTWHVARLPRAA
jgi:acyl-coenzyme A thioesterase PaaI-like protein